MRKPGIPGTEPRLFDRIMAVLLIAVALLQIAVGIKALTHNDIGQVLGSFGVAFILLSAVWFGFCWLHKDNN